MVYVYLASKQISRVKELQAIRNQRASATGLDNLSALFNYEHCPDSAWFDNPPSTAQEWDRALDPQSDPFTSVYRGFAFYAFANPDTFVSNLTADVTG